MSEELISEFGSDHNVRFLDPKQVKCYDKDGNEIDPPLCDKCKENVVTYFMCGKNTTYNLCSDCGCYDVGESKFIFPKIGD